MAAVAWGQSAFGGNAGSVEISYDDTTMNFLTMKYQNLTTKDYVVRFVSPTQTYPFKLPAKTSLTKVSLSPILFKLMVVQVTKGFQTITTTQLPSNSYISISTLGDKLFKD